jgi:hypothetical protein
VEAVENGPLLINLDGNPHPIDGDIRFEGGIFFGR